MKVFISSSDILPTLRTLVTVSFHHSIDTITAIRVLIGAHHPWYSRDEIVILLTNCASQ